MSKKKVLHITQATGGVKTYVAHIIEYADHSAFEFVVIAPPDTLFESFCKVKGIRYYNINLERDSNLLKDIVSLFMIIRIILREKPDIIHAHSAKGGFLGRLAARLTASKVLYTPHAFSYLPFTGFKRTMFFLLEVLAKRWTTLLLAISHSEANRAIYELGYAKNKVKVILNAIPVNDILIALEPHQALKIRMIGRLTAQKNPILFLEIANVLVKKYADLEFSVLGAGIHDHVTTQINEYIKENRLEKNVHIISWGNEETSRQFLMDTDIFVMTSVFEGLPFSLLEAMSLGKPCVVSKVDGNTDVINNFENGFSCLSLPEFIDKIELLINNPDLRYKIGKAGYEYVRSRHIINNSIKVVEHVYESM